MRFPPGPPAIPILGSIPFLWGKGPERFVNENMKSYGAVTGFYTGSYPTIVINDWELAKSLFQREDFAGRISNVITDWIRSTGGVSLGLVWSEGSSWTSQRNFTLKQLKNFGFGKRDLETAIWKEADEFVDYMLSLGDEVRIESSLFALPVLNVLWSIVAGHSFDRKDPEIHELLELNTFAFSSKIYFIVLHAPWIRHVLPSLTGYNKMLSAVNISKEQIRKLIKEHEKTLDIDDPRDFIDVYLKEMKTNPDPDFNTEQLIMICHDLMSAGSETVATTMNWIILYLAIHPEVQEKCYQEIQEQTYRSEGTKLITDRLNFCKATIAEVQRLSQVAVSSIQHRVKQKFTLPSGDVIPAGTIAISNITKFLTDPSLWNEPDLFSPERFLDDSGRFIKPEYFVPLGHGRRVCMGEPLARAELQIFVVALLQRIKIGTVPSKIPNPEHYNAGITKCPYDFVVSVKQRRPL